MDADVAADAIAGFLSALDGAEKQVFAARGMALLIVEERRLWEGRAPSMGQWIKQIAPQSWSDCYSAMRTVRELLPDVPLDDLKDMKRANLETVRKLSSAVRRDPQVVEGAKTQPYRTFLAETAQAFPEQHLDVRSRMDEALEMCQALEGCTRRIAAEILAEFYIAEHAVAYEEMLEGKQ